MNQAEITEHTRRGLRNPRFSSTDITVMTLLGVQNLGQIIKTSAPSYFRGRSILSSNTNIFDWPSDCESVLDVFDTLTNATDITDATNASPINIEAVDHGLVDDDIALITGVLGNTAANGTFKVTYVDDDNVTLNGSTGNATYTSGGKILKWSSTFRKLTKKEPNKQDLRSRYRWYPEGRKIVVDYLEYTYDIICNYIKRPDEITDIPEEYHLGLVGWNVINLLKIPDPKDPAYQDLSASHATHQIVYDTTKKSIIETLSPSTEPIEFNDVEEWDFL